MKKYSFHIILLLFVMAISACDKIERPEPQAKSNELNGDTVVFPAVSNTIQKIVLEEFTGHLCVNCPQGHKKAADLKVRFGDTLVVIAIHAGIFANPEPSTIYTADYRTEAGNDLNTAFGIQGYPSGLVNRTQFMGMTVLDKSAWQAAANAINRTSPKLAIQIKVGENSDNSINVFVKTTFIQATQQNIKLAIFITEDDIVSPQTNNLASIGAIPDITDYVHKHMLRGAVNSAWGAVIGTSTTESPLNSSVIKGYNYSFAGKPMVKTNCSIVAIAYDTDSKQVVQVEEIEL